MPSRSTCVEARRRRRPARCGRAARSARAGPRPRGASRASPTRPRLSTACVAGPQAPHLAPELPVLDRVADLGLDLGRQARALADVRLRRAAPALRRSRANSFWKASAKRSTPSAVSLSVISSSEMPSSSSAASVSRAPVDVLLEARARAAVPRKASNVAGGTVSTVSRPDQLLHVHAGRGTWGSSCSCSPTAAAATPAPCAASACQRSPAMLALKLW